MKMVILYEVNVFVQFCYATLLWSVIKSVLSLPCNSSIQIWRNFFISWVVHWSHCCVDDRCVLQASSSSHFVSAYIFTLDITNNIFTTLDKNICTSNLWKRFYYFQKIKIKIKINHDEHFQNLETIQIKTSVPHIVFFYRCSLLLARLRILLHLLLIVTTLPYWICYFSWLPMLSFFSHKHKIAAKPKNKIK